MLNQGPHMLPSPQAVLTVGLILLLILIVLWFIWGPEHHESAAEKSESEANMVQ